MKEIHYDPREEVPIEAKVMQAVGAYNTSLEYEGTGLRHLLAHPNDVVDVSFLCNGTQTRECSKVRIGCRATNKPEESKSCIVEKPDDIIIIDDKPKIEKSNTIYVLLGILVLSIILICLIISLVLKERKKLKGGIKENGKIKTD